jgi:predicted RNA-binding Zn ribbon-like protein
VARGAFSWVGNHPALDLCNTELVTHGRLVDVLAVPADLEAWAAAMASLRRVRGLAWPGGSTGRETLRWTRALRAALRGVLDPTMATGGTDQLNHVLQRDRGSFQVEPGAAVRVTGSDAASRFRLDLAAAALDVFSRDLSAVRRCSNPACPLLFLDTSKSGRRRWCSMQTCGNRAKVAAHYQRSRDLPARG